MVAARSGRILVTSSLSATTPTPYETVYGPTRAFVYSFAQSLRPPAVGEPQAAWPAVSFTLKLCETC